MSALDQLLRPIRYLFTGGVQATQEQGLNFIGSGVSFTAVDNAALGRTDLYVTVAARADENTYTTTSDYTLDSLAQVDRTVWCACPLASTITLPSPAAGRELYIQKQPGCATITLSGSINSGSGLTLDVDGQGVHLQGDGSTWWRLVAQ
jgi:hypothetical protein